MKPNAEGRALSPRAVESPRHDARIIARSEFVAAGFSTAHTLVRPAISDPTYGYETVNVAAQRRDPASLLNWTERIIRAPHGLAGT